ncbi:MAG: hypothetical protein MJ182_03785 [Treponema sp.]|nr:hypothetical protein [Treponema sp.]
MLFSLFSGLVFLPVGAVVAFREPFSCGKGEGTPGGAELHEASKSAVAAILVKRLTLIMGILFWIMVFASMRENYEKTINIGVRGGFIADFE